MNDANLHLLVNHFPIIGTVLGVGILIGGMVLKNNTVINVSYFLFVFGAIFSVFTMSTGEGAEEVVEHMQGISENLIEAHEEIAEKLALILYLLGAVSLVGLYLNFKKHNKANLISFLALAVAFVGIYAAKEVGTSGGEIRHSEIRTEASVDKTENSSQGEEH